MRTYLIGVDEAGYGPNLGPLCIGATAWKVPTKIPEQQAVAPGASLGLKSVDVPPTPGLRQRLEATGELASCQEIDLYKLLSEIVTQTPSEGKIAIADSKQLYKPASHAKGGVGLRHLELGVLSALAASQRKDATPTNVEELFAETNADADNHRVSIPWHQESSERLPVDAKPQAVNHAACRFRRELEKTKVELCDLRVRLVYPEEFNSLVEKYETKGAALSHVTLALVRKVIDSLSNETSHCPASSNNGPVAYDIVCDKHGGRNRYAALLQHHFPEHWIETELESRGESRYRWQSETSQVTISFRSKGESFLPAALASMIAKYHRELAMRSFNAYWQKYIPGIKPTAGYPQDAKRFQAEIAEKQRELGIDDRVLWRNR